MEAGCFVVNVFVHPCGIIIGMEHLGSTTKQIINTCSKCGASRMRVPVINALTDNSTSGFWL